MTAQTPPAPTPPSPTPDPAWAERLAEAPLDAVVAEFHKRYYYARLWEQTYWLGTPAWKCPLDLWIYQEILTEVRPELVVECGTAHGGSALFLATVMDALGVGRVLSIDIEPRPDRPRHPRIEYYHGSTLDDQTVAYARERAERCQRVMVILDSLHSRDHVLAELRRYHPLVTPGSYLIVEDTNISGHPVYTDYEPDAGEGAFEAVEAFLRDHREFVIDRSREKFFMTFNPCGYLRRLGDPRRGAGPDSSPREPQED